MEEKDLIQEQENVQTDSAKYLTFFINGQRYGIPISIVMEIISTQKITEVPEFPYYAKGITNLRGLIVPLIDVNLRIGYEEQEYTSKTCIIVVNVDGIDVGLIIDEIDEVIDITSDAINPPPGNTGEAADYYVDGIAVLPEKLILLMSCEKLIGDEFFEM